jgi:hypothetical protein
VVLIFLGSSINLPVMIIIKIISAIVQWVIVSLLRMESCGLVGVDSVGIEK